MKSSNNLSTFKNHIEEINEVDEEDEDSVELDINESQNKLKKTKLNFKKQPTKFSITSNITTKTNNTKLIRTLTYGKNKGSTVDLDKTIKNNHFNCDFL